MATIRIRYYTMPKGPDGKRHRVWHEMSQTSLTELVKSVNKDLIKSIIGTLERESPYWEMEQP